MSNLLNDNDVSIQAAPYRDKTTLVTVSSTATNFITAKNGGATTPSNISLTASPNIVFTAAAVYTWTFALNTAPTTWRVFDGSLIQGTTTFTGSGVSANKAGTYTNLTQLSTSGSGTGAKFTITKSGTSTAYAGNITVTITSTGIGYKVGDTIVISGGFLGGSLTTNNLTITLGGTVTSETGTVTKAISSDTIKALVGTSLASSIQVRCAVSENFLDTAYGYATLTYSLEQANSDSITIDLTRTTSSISTSLSGTPVNFNNTGTTITVIRAGTALVYDVTGGTAVATATPNSFAVEIVTDPLVDATVATRTVGTTSNTTTSWSLSGITALTADYATVLFLVTVYDASGNKTQSTYKTLSYNKVSNGSNGENAVVYFIDLSAPIISKTTSSKFEAGVHSQLTIYGKKIIGTNASTTYGFLTVTGDGDTESATATAATNAGLTTTIANTSQNSKYTVKLYNIAARTDQAAVLLDTQVVPVVFNGANGIVATLTNDSTTVPVSAGGIAATGGYDNTGTLVHVYEGAAELTYNTAGTTNGTYKITVTTNSINAGTVSKVANTVYATVAKSNTISADTASITFTIEGTSKGGNTFSIIKTQTINKAYPGSDAQLYFLQLSSPVISKDSASAIIDGNYSSIVITGKQTIGNALPTTVGFVTFAPTVAVLSISSNNVYLSGISTFVVGDQIAFSGTGLPGGITLGYKYYIKTINTDNKSVTISSIAAGSTLGLSSTANLTTAFATIEPITATANSITTTSISTSGAYSFLARLYTSATKASQLDSATIPVLFKGSNSVTAVLSNDSAAIPCDGAANPISGGYANTTTAIRVYDGTTELTYDNAGLTNGTYKVVATGNNITAGTISVSDIYALSSIASSVNSNLSSITFTITGKTTNGSAINISKIQSFSKSIGGKDGADGLTYKSATVTAYGWSNSDTPPALAGTFNYNWSTGAITAGTGLTSAYPTGYTETAGSSTANNQTLHQVTITVSDLSTVTTTNNVAWSGAKANKLAYREDGSMGFTGDASRTVYIVTTSATPPGIPTAGLGDVVPTSPDGIWKKESTSTLNTGEFMYQSDGTYKAATNTVTWRAPYLSNLKVGNLSALSADLGNINAGAINIGPNKFIVDREGNVKIRGSGTGTLEITNEYLKVFDSTGALRVLLGNLDS